MKNKQRAMSLDSTLPLYGAEALFSLCGDGDLLSLSFEGQQPLLDWIGWVPSDEYFKRRDFLSWIRPEYSTGSPTVGYVGDPCGEANGVEYGVCDFSIEDFARLRRHGPTRDMTQNDMKHCVNQPRYRLDGTQIMDNTEYDLRLVAEVLLQDFKRMLISGNANTAGQFDGLARLIKSGYTNSKGHRCKLMDSIVIDWNGNSLNGGSGITWNGAAVASSFNFIDVLLAAFRRVIQRIRLAPSLAAQRRSVGDMILVMPSGLINCVLKSYTCWSVCDGGQYNEVALQSYEARKFREGLNGGMFGDGRIFLDSFEIPLLGYDWGLINGPTRGDIYLLTGQIGSVKTLQGEYLNLNGVPQQDDRFTITDGGRIMHWSEREKTCIRWYSEMRPRLIAWAPWAQVRFQDVKCTEPGGFLSPDPTETSFFPESSFFPMESED
jgi:hypothetical protein